MNSRNHTFWLASGFTCFALLLAIETTSRGEIDDPATEVPREVSGDGRLLLEVGAADFKEGWRFTVPVPETLVSVKAACELRVENGWLYVKRSSEDGMEWEVILAEVSQGVIPQIAVIEGQPAIEVSYADGRYFIRDTSFAFRVVRQRKRDVGPFFRLAERLPDGAKQRGHATSRVGPVTLSGWEDDEWFFVGSGPDRERFDCFVRLNPKALDAPGYGFQSLGGGLAYVFHGETWEMDDGELLVAVRTLPDAYQLELAMERIRQKMPGSTPPEIDAATWLNTERKLTWADLRGKVVLLDFWATWCGPCVARLPDVQELQRKYAKRPFVVIGVHSAQAAESCEEFVKSHGLSFPIAVDTGKTEEQFAVGSLPAYFLVDSEGKVVYGYLSHPPTEAAIEALLPQ